jgi:hypothetical protein
MAYVAVRRNGRFEVRESLHTSKGPRARTLAGFKELSDEVLVRAQTRAARPFDTEAVIESAERAGAPVSAKATTSAARTSSPAPSSFVAASRRMASSLRHTAAASVQSAPGDTLIDLLGFADAVTASQPARSRERLAFPPLGRLVQNGPAVAGAR